MKQAFGNFKKIKNKKQAEARGYTVIDYPLKVFNILCE